MKEIPISSVAPMSREEWELIVVLHESMAGPAFLVPDPADQAYRVHRGLVLGERTVTKPHPADGGAHE